MKGAHNDTPDVNERYQRPSPKFGIFGPRRHRNDIKASRFPNDINENAKPTGGGVRHQP
jgi:hypothetical protein